MQGVCRYWASPSTIGSGATAHNSSSTNRPFDRNAAESGTLMRACTTTPDDAAIKGGDSRAETLLPTERTNPQTKADSGAQTGPTDAMPSVANSEALRLPM